MDRRFHWQGVLPKIYGVSWNHGTSATLTRTDNSIGMTAAVGLGMTPVTNNFDTAEIYKDICEVTDSLGNVFVRIPKFWIEKTDDGTSLKTWRISKGSFGTAYLPKCFLNGTIELDYVDVGKYNANLNGTKLESKSGYAPLVSKNITEFRTYATNNGLGYQQLDIHVVDVLQTLFIVEFATINSQSIVSGFSVGDYTASRTATVAETGVTRIIVSNANATPFVVSQTISIGTSQGGNQIFYGRTITSIEIYDVNNKSINFDGTPVNISVGNIVYSTGWISGFSINIVAKSGSIGSNSSGKYPCMYRGIENPWASIWQFVDGINIANGQAWVCNTPSSYLSDKFTSPYEVLSYVDSTSNGYVSKMGYDSNHKFAELPTALVGNGSNYYGDYYYYSSGNRIAFLGGSWYYGSNDGFFCWALDSSSTSTYITVGGRLLKKPL